MYALAQLNCSESDITIPYSDTSLSHYRITDIRDCSLLLNKRCVSNNWLRTQSLSGLDSDHFISRFQKSCLFNYPLLSLRENQAVFIACLPLWYWPGCVQSMSAAVILARLCSESVCRCDTGQAVFRVCLPLWYWSGCVQSMSAAVILVRLCSEYVCRSNTGQAVSRACLLSNTGQAVSRIYLPLWYWSGCVQSMSAEVILVRLRSESVCRCDTGQAAFRVCLPLWYWSGCVQSMSAEVILVKLCPEYVYRSNTGQAVSRVCLPK